MLDATAKIPSGILQGNGIQLGDFDQCLGSRARVQLESGSVVKVQGQYCLARLDVKADHPELELPVHLAQAKNLIKSRIDDVSACFCLVITSLGLKYEPKVRFNQSLSVESRV